MREVKLCDHEAVGVIISNSQDDLLMITRAQPPIGIAPVAGHVDEHGGAREAAMAEAREEVGLAVSGLMLTDCAMRSNVCRRPYARPGFPGHVWTIFQVVVGNVQITPSAEETLGARWYSRAEVQSLADRTVDYAYGQIDHLEWRMHPGIEPVWIRWLRNAGYIHGITRQEMAAVELLACTAPGVQS